ncbi:MAG TPA: MlaD family protein [Thermoleophilaceae bacterium]|nr:MlaD family protein [Thermoleophilaceae bacterium]
MLTVGALVLAVVVTAALMFGAGDDYRVRVVLDNSGQLVKGNQVKVGGTPVGLVTSIELGPDSRAVLELRIDDGDLAPLHEGTVATLRAASLSGIANRYLALAPGPNDAPEIPDGGAIPAEDVNAAVDLDQLLNTLDAGTQEDLRRAVRRSAAIFDRPGTAQAFNRGLETLNPFLSQSAATGRELAADQRALERLVVEFADTSSAIASRRGDVEEGTANALAAATELATESASLEDAIGRLPPVLRRTNTTLVNLRSLLRDLRPAITEARPAAPLLSEFLVRLREVSSRARPELRSLRRLISRGSRGDLLNVLAALERVSAAAVPAFDSATATSGDGLPVLQEARPYTPEVIGGLVNGFGGTTSNYYDANGHYARISFQGSSATATNEGTLVPNPDGPDGLSGYRTGVTRRCPGAATQPHRDGSNPFTDGRDDFPCDLGDTPR